MGNVSVREGGRNPTGAGVEGRQFHSGYHAQGGSQEMMGQSPPHSHSHRSQVILSPIIFIFGACVQEFHLLIVDTCFILCLADFFE